MEYTQGVLQQIEGQLAAQEGREEAQAEVEGPQSAGGTQGQGGGPLAAGRVVQGLQSEQGLQGALGLLGGQGQTSGEPGLGHSGKYYSTPAVTEHSVQEWSSDQG